MVIGKEKKIVLTSVEKNKAMQKHLICTAISVLKLFVDLKDSSSNVMNDPFEVY